jgi:hypothetical protein
MKRENPVANKWNWTYILLIVEKVSIKFSVPKAII